MKFSCSLPKRETGSLHFFPLSSLRSSDLSSMENSHAFNQETTSDGSDPFLGSCFTRQQSEAGASGASSVSSPDSLRPLLILNGVSFWAMMYSPNTEPNTGYIRRSSPVRLGAAAAFIFALVFGYALRPHGTRSAYRRRAQRGARRPAKHR